MHIEKFRTLVVQCIKISVTSLLILLLKSLTPLFCLARNNRPSNQINVTIHIRRNKEGEAHSLTNYILLILG